MADRTEIAIEVAATSVANKTTMSGAVAGFIGWLADINWIGLTGTLVAVLGFAASLYFQWRRNRREEELHAAQMAALRERCNL